MSDQSLNSARRIARLRALNGHRVLSGEYVSSTAAIAATGNRITYRQLDHWVRTGKVKPTIEADGSGSGNHRGWSKADVAALGELLDELDEAHAIVAEFDSGSMWKRLLDERAAG